MQSNVHQIPEEYLDAQRAAIEAVYVGRATLEETSRQGEQLSHAEKMANETQYALDKSNRLLKGMTWSGWISNIFSKDIEPPDVAAGEEQQISYQGVSNVARPTAQAIHNYQANLMIFDTCETQGQKETCRIVCDTMYQIALKELAKLEPLQTDGQTQIFKHQFRKDIAFLRRRQDQKQQKKVKSESFIAIYSPSQPTTAKILTSKSLIQTQQEDHLDMLASNLGELHTMAHSLGEMMGHQHRIMENLDSKSEQMYETSKTVTRRADRLAQQKAWTSAKKTFECYVTIQQLSNGRYMTNCNGSLNLSEDLSSFAIFALWRRKGGMIGLRNKGSCNWIGQTLMGGLACNSSSFGQREEWQIDKDWSESRLLCASAGWGNGGYLIVKDGQLQIGAGGVEGKAKAETFCIQVVGNM